MQMKDRPQSGPFARFSELFKFSRIDLAVLPFIFAGLGAAFITAMGAMAMGYDSRPKDIHALLSNAALLLFFPAFLLALLQRRWAALPMWLCCIALLAPALAHPKDMITASSLKGEIELVSVVLLTELARLIRGSEPEKMR
jgi:hypothetical protein